MAACLTGEYQCGRCKRNNLDCSWKELIKGGRSVEDFVNQHPHLVQGTPEAREQQDERNAKARRRALQKRTAATAPAASQPSSVQSSVSGSGAPSAATSGNNWTHNVPTAAGTVPETPPGMMSRPQPYSSYHPLPGNNTLSLGNPQASGYGLTQQVAPSPVASMASRGSHFTGGYSGLRAVHWPQPEGVLPPGLPAGFMSYGDPGVDVHRFPPGTNLFLQDAAAASIYSLEVEDGQGDQGSYGRSVGPVACHSASPYDVSSVLGSFEPGAPAYVNVDPRTYGPIFQLPQGMPAPPPDGLPSWVTVSNDMVAASGSGVSGSPQAHHSQTQGNPSTHESAGPPTQYSVWTSYDPEGGY